MGRMLITLIVSTMLAAPAARAADLPPESAFNATFYIFENSKEAFDVKAADNKAAWVFAEAAVYLNDAGAGFFHDVTGRCIGMGSGDDNATHNPGHCTYIDADGDLIYSTFDVNRSGKDQPNHGTKMYTGGTGKYLGLTGTAQYTITSLKTLDKDVPVTLKGQVQGRYKIQPVVAGSPVQK